MEEKGLKLILDMNADKFKQKIAHIRNETNQWNSEIQKLKQSLKFDGKNVEQYTALVDRLKNKYNETEKAIGDLKQILDASLETGKIQKNSSEWVDLTNKIIILEKNLQITGRNIEEVNRDWEKNGRVGKDTLNGLNRELTEQKSLWERAHDKSDVFFANLKANLATKVITGGLDLIKNAISGIINGIKELTKGYVNLMKEGISYQSSLQDYTKSLGIILDGDEERAANVVAGLKKASAQLGVDIQPLVEGTQQLAIAGVGVEDASEAILGFSKALKLVGADSGALQLVITNLMQLQTQGGATARDLREFATKGIPIYKLLAEYSERFAEGTYEAKDVKFEDVVGAMLKAINDPNSAFSKSETIIAATFSGQIETARVRWQQLLGDLAQETTVAATTKVLPAINDLLYAMTTAFDENGLEGVKEAFANGIGDVIAVLSDEGVIESLFSGIDTLIDALIMAFDPSTIQGQRNKRALSQMIDKIVMILDSLFDAAYLKIVQLGEILGSAIFEGMKNAFIHLLTDWWYDFINTPMEYIGQDPRGNNRNGGGYNGLQNINTFNSGSFATPQNRNFTSNLTVNVQNGNNITDETVRGWANIINKQLGDDFG